MRDVKQKAGKGTGSVARLAATGKLTGGIVQEDSVYRLKAEVGPKTYSILTTQY